MKKLTIENIKVIMSTVYQTNITAANFDALKEYINRLPNIEQVPEPAQEITEAKS